MDVCLLAYELGGPGDDHDHGTDTGSVGDAATTQHPISTTSTVPNASSGKRDATGRHAVLDRVWILLWQVQRADAERSARVLLQVKPLTFEQAELN